MSRGLRAQVDNTIPMWIRNSLLGSEQVVSKLGLSLTMWVEVEQNDVVGLSIGDASRKACA